MAASIVLSDPGRAIEDTGLRQVIDELSRSYFEAVPDAITRRALEASSVVRCVTEPLLRALLPGVSPRDTLERLSALPFCERGREGLFIHDAVRSAIATSLAARDPDSHREYRRAAWTYLQERSRPVYPADMWHHTADLLFLLENPVLREGFFPSGPHPLAVEPSTPGDEAEVRRIAAAHAAPQLEALTAWWRHQPEAFHVVRDQEGSVCGFYIMTRGSELSEGVVIADPVAAAWRRDVARRVPASTLFCRGWLERESGEAHSPSQAASWVDIKRTYIEMRKSLRWVYMALMNPAPYGEVATRLGFRPLTEATVDIGGSTLYSFVLDMGPGSVDGWLASLVGAEIAEQAARPSDLLDIEARELMLPAGRISLTSLEFGVMRHLQERPGKAIGRYDLMEAVWRYRNPTASNVVDVVVRSLRRKLGDEAPALATVRGTGYRYRTRASAAPQPA